jgi:hypothetical protein
VSDLQQIRTALDRLFQEEDQRIIFWNDPYQEFLTTLPLLDLDGVTTLRKGDVVINDVGSAARYFMRPR